MSIFTEIHEKNLCVSLKGDSKEEILEQMLNSLEKEGDLLDIDLVKSDVWERENSKATGLEKGIALPHAKTKGVKNLILRIGLVPQGVNFDAVDDLPSRIIILAVTPPSQQELHLKLLMEVASLAQNVRFVEELPAMEDPEMILSLFRGKS